MARAHALLIVYSSKAVDADQQSSALMMGGYGL
jgi:hypothetical protein